MLPQVQPQPVNTTVQAAVGEGAATGRGPGKQWGHITPIHGAEGGQWNPHLTWPQKTSTAASTTPIFRETMTILHGEPQSPPSEDNFSRSSTLTQS